MLAAKSNWTLEDYIVSLFMQHKTDSDEFRVMLRIYGREKLEGFWRDYKKRTNHVSREQQRKNQILDREE